MAHRGLPAHLHGEASSSRVSLAASDHSAASSRALTPQGIPMDAGAHAGKYPISTILQEPTPSSSLLPALPALPSASSYLPSQLSSLSTTFTSAGSLPRSATPAGKSVAQRRSQAPPIVVTELRKVQKSEFDAYLHEVGGEYERWERETRLGRKGTVDMGAEDVVEPPERAEELGLGIAGAAGAAATARRVKPPKPEEVLPSLEEIPPIFFDADFNLSNPRTFDLVTERIQLSPSPSPNLSSSSLPPSSSSSSTSRPASARQTSTALEPSLPGLGPHTLTDLASDQLLQDKLSHYTAVIESHLVREIGLRSASFFAALSNLQSLHTQGEETLGKIEELKRVLKNDENGGGVGNTAKHGLQILRAQARRRGLERVEDAVRAVEDVWSAVEGVRELVENGEWEGALEVSEGIEEAYYGSASSSSSDSPPPASPIRPSLSSSSPSQALSSSSRRPLNLTKLTSLASLPIKLTLLRAQIAKSLEGELITVLEHEMDSGIEEYVRGRKEWGGEWKGKGKGKRKAGGEGKAGETAASVVAAASASASSAAAAGALAGTTNGGLAGVPEEAVEADEVDEETEEEGEESLEEKAKERAIERVRPVVRALVRAEGMDSAVAAWRESVLREVRALVREHLPTAETPTAEEEDQFAQAAIRSVSKQSIDLGTISEKSLSLAKKLRALSHDDFLSLARETYLGLLACIHVVDLQARVLLELYAQARAGEQARKARQRRVVNGVDQQQQQLPPSPSSSTLTVPGTIPPSSSPAPPSDSRSTASSTSATADDSTLLLSSEIADVVHAVSELANVRFSKILGVRTEVHSHLPLPSFVELFDLTWTFVLECEVVCQRMIVGLRGAAVSQAKGFLMGFHQRRITGSAKVVEEEQWGAVEVPRERQREVERIVEAAVRDPVELLLGERRKAKEEEREGKVVEVETNGDGPSDHSSGVDGSDAEAAAPPATGPAKQVTVEGRSFFAVSAGLTTIGVLVEYLTVLLNCPMLTTDCMSKIIEFMKAFNSRTCQVVLGAGAMRSAGLKNITAKHLALASQSLSLMVALIPYIRECVRRHLNPKQAVMLTEFDKLKRDYQEHQHEIHAKLVAIMSDRLVVHSRTLEGINWENPSPSPGTPNAYMESLVKEHLTLHKVLSRFLAPETVHLILSQVFTALDARLLDVMGRVELKSQEAKERMVGDVRYLREKLGGLKGMEGEGPAKDLEPLIQSKSLPAPPPPPPAPPSSSSTSLPAPRPSLPPRTSSIQTPSTSPFSSPTPQPAHPASLNPSAPPTPIPSLSPRPSTESARTSIDGGEGGGGGGKAPPSPILGVPEALPPAEEKKGPAPYVKKSFAERMAERLGKKPASAAPPAHATVTATAAATVEPVVPAAAPAPIQTAEEVKVAENQEKEKGEEGPGKEEGAKTDETKKPDKAKPADGVVELDTAGAAEEDEQKDKPVEAIVEVPTIVEPNGDNAPSSPPPSPPPVDVPSSTSAVDAPENALSAPPSSSSAAPPLFTPSTERALDELAMDEPDVGAVDAVVGGGGGGGGEDGMEEVEKVLEEGEGEGKVEEQVEAESKEDGLAAEETEKEAESPSPAGAEESMTNKAEAAAVPPFAAEQEEDESTQNPSAADEPVPSSSDTIVNSVPLADNTPGEEEPAALEPSLPLVEEPAPSSAAEPDPAPSSPAAETDTAPIEATEDPAPPSYSTSTPPSAAEFAPPAIAEADAGAEPSPPPPVVENSLPPSRSAPPATQEPAPTPASPSATAADLAPPIPVVSPTPPVPSPVPAPTPTAPAAAAPAALSDPPQKRKTLKERLAEAARKRGSLGGGMIDEVAPSSATVVEVGKKVEAERKVEAVEKKEEVEKKVEMVQKKGEEADGAPPPSVVAEAEKGKVKEEDKPAVVQVEQEEPIEEEESSFL